MSGYDVHHRFVNQKDLGMAEVYTNSDAKSVITSLKFSKPLWDHQVSTLTRIIENKAKRWGLLFEPGGGKTLTTIALLKLISRTKGLVPRVLILCPQGVRSVWLKQIAEEVSPRIQAQLQVLDGVKTKRAKQLKDASKKIFIASLDILNTDSFDIMLKMPWDVIVPDEFHNFKDPTAKRTKKLFKVVAANPNSFRFPLTGTPILNTPLDCYTLLKFLGVMKDSYTSFKLRYFEDANAGFANKPWHFPKWVIRPGAEAELNTLIDSCCSRVLLEDCMDLPPLVRQEVLVPLTPEAARLYSDLAKHFVTDVLQDAKKYISAELVIEQTLRLQQVANGIARCEELRGDGTIKSTTEHVPCGKYQALREQLEIILANPKNKVVIWSCWADTYGKIAEVVEDCGVFHTSITGLDTAKEKAAAVERFQTDPTCRVVIANQQAGGEGIDLTAGNYAIYFSKNHRLGADIQSQARTLRPGSERHKSIVRIDIISEGTVEEQITQALKDKKTVAELVLDIRRAHGLRPRRVEPKPDGRDGLKAA